jgi:hypothetical protein
MQDYLNAEDFNRFKLGRVLDRIDGFGTEILFNDISMNVCRQAENRKIRNFKD